MSALSVRALPLTPNGVYWGLHAFRMGLHMANGCRQYSYRACLTLSIDLNPNVVESTTSNVSQCIKHSLVIYAILTTSLIMFRPTSVPSIVASINETWSPRLVASINDHHVKVAKIDGAFIWHAHPDSEELFYLLSGKLQMQIEGQDAVVMAEGDVFVVPKGVRHKPVAENACIMMVEHESTVNTGDEEGSERTREPVDVRGALRQDKEKETAKE